MRHWHAHEHELVCALAGELVLVTDEGERSLHAGRCSGFPAGHRSGHQLLNRGATPAVHLEISNRDAADSVE